MCGNKPKFEHDIFYLFDTTIDDGLERQEVVMLGGSCARLRLEPMTVVGSAPK